MITSPTDFKGFYKQSANSYDKVAVQLFINKFEPLYLCRLLGADLYTDFEADLVDGVPTSQKYLDIFNAFCESEGRCLYQSEGMKEMLKGFLFYEYTTTTNLQHTIAGVQQNESDNTTQTSIENIYRNAEQRFNLSIATWDAIQWKVCDNENEYFSDTITNSMQEINPVFQGIL
jgi:hypothetical protein